LEERSLKFKVEGFNDVYLEMEPFFKAHYEELATLKEHIRAPEPDWLLYANLEMAGKLHTVTAREAGALVGYYIGIVTHHPHYKSVIFASADIYYLAPEYRKAQNGVLFLQFIEKSLKEAGAHMMVMGTKLQKDLSLIYEAMRYTETDRVFRKWLD
jgi:GNAT superfamily N-acetyltransferase